MNKEELLDFYTTMLRIRFFEEEVCNLYAEGKIPGLVHAYIGEEAIATGACAALEEGDNITSTHRGHGHCLAMGMNSKKMMAEIIGKETGTNKGMGGSMHIVNPSKGVLGATGIVGAGIPIAAGAGLSARVKNNSKVTLAFFGDGATNTGAFHEGINLASVWNLPVVFICENNQYGADVPASKSLKIEDIVERADSYSITGKLLNGMDCVEVYKGVKEAVRRAREGKGPSLIECKSYRYHRHHEGKAQELRESKEIEEWKERDPLEKMKKRLFEKDFIDEGEDKKIRENVKEEIKNAREFAEKSSTPDSNILKLKNDLYSPSKKLKENINTDEEVEKCEIDCVEAIRETLHEEMDRDKGIVVYGEDVAEPGGIFNCTQGLLDEFGAERVRDTPISEEAILGSATGAALTGLRPIPEIEFFDFITRAMDGLCNQMAKLRFMSGGQVSLPVTIRAPTGTRYPFAAGAAHHSQELSAWFAHTPGLKVVTYSTPFEAKGLLKASIREDNPVLFLEHKSLYYAKGVKKVRKKWPKLVESVPQKDYTIPLGEADLKKRGDDVTIVANMLMVHKALNVAKKLEKEEGVSVEIVNPRSIVPLDDETIIKSVEKTGKCVVAIEGPKRCGVGAEISSIIAENATYFLEAPIKRVGSHNMPNPYSPSLEKEIVPLEEDIEKAVTSVMGA